jgi:hypothetical protein
VGLKFEYLLRFKKFFRTDILWKSFPRSNPMNSCPSRFLGNGFHRYLKTNLGLNGMAKLDTEKRESLSSSQFACPQDRKLPINDAAHVRNAMARFDQVMTNDCHPDAAKRRILEAAKKFGVDVGDFGKVKQFKKHVAA